MEITVVDDRVTVYTAGNIFIEKRAEVRLINLSEFASPVALTK